MAKEYNRITEVLTVGTENVSPKLKWLLGLAIADTAPAEALNCVVYNTDLPEGIWGAFSPEVRGLAVNLEQHFISALEAVQDEKHMNTSIRFIILRDLLDTVMHEAYHAKACMAINDFRDGNLDEEGAIKHAETESWRFGLNTDVEIDSFGPVIDGLLADLYKDLEEDCKEEDCKEWKRIQLHMMKMGLAYYDSESGVEITNFRDVMNAVCEENWGAPDSSFRTFTNVEAEAAPKKPETKVAPQPVVEAPPQPAAQKPMVVTLEDDLEPVPIEDEVGTEAVQQPVVQPTVQPQAVPTVQPTQTQPTAQPVMNAQQIQQIAETVLRRIFHHIYTKCAPTPDGRFGNPSAALEPIPIGDIPGATDLFVKQDTVDEMGVFQSKADVAGFIKGLVSRQGLPRYSLYLNIGGNLVKRTFIPQNPDKTKTDGSLTAWAQKVRNGWKIAMLLEDDKGPRADIQLGPGEPLGQEVFKVWNK